MIKILNYFLQSIFIYFFFLIARMLGLSLSRKLFSTFFLFFGPIFKSTKTINRNLNIFSNNIGNYEALYDNIQVALSDPKNTTAEQKNLFHLQNTSCAGL